MITVFAALSDRELARADRILRRQLRVRSYLLQTIAPARARALRHALHDEIVFEQTLAETWTSYAEHPAIEEIGDGRLLDQFLRFANWIIENWDTIEKIVVRIIGLFAGLSTGEIERLIASMFADHVLTDLNSGTIDELLDVVESLNTPM